MAMAVAGPVVDVTAALVESTTMFRLVETERLIEGPLICDGLGGGNNLQELPLCW